MHPKTKPLQSKYCHLFKGSNLIWGILESFCDFVLIVDGIPLEHILASIYPGTAEKVAINKVPIS